MVFLCGPAAGASVVLLPASQTRRRARTPPRAAYQVQLRSQMWLDPTVKV
jgi:hypothetical protein